MAVQLHHHLEDQPSKFSKENFAMNDVVLIISSNKTVKHKISNRLCLSLFFNILPIKFFFLLSLSSHCLVAKLNYCCLYVEEKERKERTHNNSVCVSINIDFSVVPISSLLVFFSRTTRGEQPVKEIFNRNFFFFSSLFSL